MAYATILAYLPDASSVQPVLDAARLVGERGPAHLIGLYVYPAMRVYGAMPMDVPDVTAQLIEQNREYHEAESAKVKDLFEQAFKAGDMAIEWRFAETMRTDALPEIIEQGRAAELIIVRGRGEDASDAPRIAENLMMESGRPVLIVPDGGCNSIGANITVGWNGSRESARAVFDALPLLRTADEVHLVWIDPQLPLGQSTSRAADDIAATLARAGVKCDAATPASGSATIGAELLERASDHGSDLIVMGGYGRTRFREMIFGGTTRHVLDNTALPILMSH